MYELDFYTFEISSLEYFFKVSSKQKYWERNDPICNCKAGLFHIQSPLTQKRITWLYFTCIFFLDFDIKLLELVLVLDRSDGHHVGVESEEIHTVSHPQDGEEILDDANNEIIPETKESQREWESTVDHQEDEQDVDVDGDNVGLDLDDGTQDQDGEDKAQKISDKSSDRPAKWDVVVVPEDEEDQEAGEPHKVSDELEDQQGQTAHFNGFEDPSSPVVPDSVEEEDVEDEKKNSVQKSQDPIPKSQDPIPKSQNPIPKSQGIF